jgi:hypothetical protein
MFYVLRVMHRRVYRSRGSLAAGVVIAALVSAACLVDAVLSTEAKYWGADGGIAALVWGSLLVTRRVGVRLESDGVRVVNLLRRQRLRWDEIERFELAPAGIYPYAGHVILKSGRDIPIGGITVPRFLTDRLKPRAQEPVDELNAILRANTRPS